MTAAEAKQALEKLEEQLHAYRHALNVMSYDGDTVAPKRSAADRGRTMGILSGVVHEMCTAAGTRELLETLLNAGDAVDAVTRRRAEVLKEECDLLVLVPAEEYMAYQTLLAESSAVWRDAKRNSDFAAFAPYLEKIIAYNRRLAARRDAGRPAYDVLLDLYEKGLCMDTLESFFSVLRRELTPVILEVAERPQPDDAFLHRYYPVELQRKLTDRVMATMGLDRARCAVGETEHPFTNGFSNQDVRITTHYYEHDVSSSLYSVIHEGGHALYELGVSDALQGTVLAGGSSMGIHESQSRFYENLIGRSRAFCQWLLPVLREIFPEQTEGVTEEALYRAVNRAQPSLIRTEADELTYAMHVMVRYEMEKRLMDGTLRVADVPGEWNRMMKAYLGIEVPSDRYGCLQDSHWSGGLLGYFPSYALGSAYGVQMLRNLERDVDLWPAVARGDCSPVTEWLGERIHRFGQLKTPSELLQNALEGPFEPTCYTEYLKAKFSALYGL